MRTRRTPAAPLTSQVIDDADTIREGDRVLLVVENDPAFARIMVDVAHDKGFKVLAVSRGAAALILAAKVRPAAITLDINLPDIDGWRVMDRLKDNPATRHIPIQIITTDEERERGLRMGAVGVLQKPVKTREDLDQALLKLQSRLEPRKQDVLVVEGDPDERMAIADLLAGDDVQINSVGTGSEALKQIEARKPDLVVLGLELPDHKRLELAERLAAEPSMAEVPIIVYSRKEIAKREEAQLKRLTQASLLREVRSPDRLLDDAALFLHRSMERMVPEKRERLENLHGRGTVLAGKKVLIVDDDIRNIFAMTSILEPHQMKILSAETGNDAIEILRKNRDIDIALMDIMMPDMDGYDTMQAIRRLPRFRLLPIIALTAKAMKGDREKCLAAGASDYISKPVDTEHLLALLRVWLYR